MDITETYIKMCEKAGEIQVHRFEMNDCYFAMRWDGHPAVYFTQRPLEPKHFHIYAWLPRQDQLQAMCHELTETKWTPFLALTLIRDFAQEHSYISMEQLWLAFVMKESYGKIWSNGEWVKEETDGKPIH